jgi:hypothetical protein
MYVTTKYLFNLTLRLNWILQSRSSSVCYTMIRFIGVRLLRTAGAQSNFYILENYVPPTRYVW